MSTHGGTSTSAPPATTVTGPDAIGAPAVVGTGLHYARNDHDHGLPALDYNAMQYNDLLGWTYDLPGLVLASALPSAATIYLARISLPVARTVTNVLVINGATGLVLTHSFAALFKSNGVIVGQTADQSGVWGTGGPGYGQTLALSGGPYTCTPLAANDFVWAAIYVGTSTGALPQFDINNQYFCNLGTVAGRSRSGYIAQADTATLGSIIPANITPLSGYLLWMGIS